ncbi:MAG: hypothetical protein FD132_2711, partial [bacterium]
PVTPAPAASQPAASGTLPFWPMLPPAAPPQPAAKAPAQVAAPLPPTAEAAAPTAPPLDPATFMQMFMKPAEAPK